MASPHLNLHEFRLLPISSDNHKVPPPYCGSLRIGLASVREISVLRCYDPACSSHNTKNCHRSQQISCLDDQQICQQRRCRPITVVSSIPELLLLLDNLSGLPVEPPSLYFDLEVIRLGRRGSISLVVLYIVPQSMPYIVDVHILGSDALFTTNCTGNSLKSVIESPRIPKVFFDIRNDSDALYTEYHIYVSGIIDIQLLEFATRNDSKEYVVGLARCIEKDSDLSGTVKQLWRRTKEDVSRLYDPGKDGFYGVFNERPLKTEILQYCRQDVELLPTLWEVYSCNLRGPGNGAWRSMIRKATQERIKLSQSVSYDGQAESKVYGPWDFHNIREAIDDWNDDVIIWGVNAGMMLDEDDHWVKPPQKQVLKSSVFTLVADVYL